MFLRTYTYRFTFALSLFLGFTSSLLADINPSVSFPFEVINGLTIIQAEIDGEHGLYLLDTGSDGVFIDGVVNSNKESIVTLGGSADISTKMLKELKVGAFRHQDFEAQIISLSPIEEHLGIDLKGIIGGHLFLPKVVTIDFQNSLIVLSDKLTKEEKIQFENKIKINIVNQIPVAKIEIENRTYQFALDSGSSIHFIDTKILQNLENVVRTQEMSTMKCLANKNNEIQKIRIEKFNIGEASFQEQTYLHRDFQDVNQTMGINLDGILSLSQLSKDMVVIDYSRGRLYF